jgi:hypothetical protein
VYELSHGAQRSEVAFGDFIIRALDAEGALEEFDQLDHPDGIDGTGS